jgi:hypothetical protein
MTMSRPARNQKLPKNALIFAQKVDINPMESITNKENAKIRPGFLPADVTVHLSFHITSTSSAAQKSAKMPVAI